jgi:hypothetical protein
MPYKLNPFTGQFDYYQTGSATVDSHPSSDLLLENESFFLLEDGVSTLRLEG